MNEQELQQAFLQYLAQKTGAKSQQELETIIQQMGEEGLKQAYAEFMQMMQQQQVQAARFGAKLDYIKSLRGQCPEGYELQYYKSGGKVCKKCVQQKKQMKSQKPIDEFKCGRKMKKKENGGELNSTRNPSSFSKMTLAKCGAKLKKAAKKCYEGGTVEMDKCGKKIKKKEFGGDVAPKKPQKKLDPKTTKTLPGGKYPSYWTSQQRQQWERTYGPNDEGAAATNPLPKNKPVVNKKK